LSPRWPERTMAFEGLIPVTDISVGDWLEPRMCGFGGQVGSVVPTMGFEAFARVLHPAADERGRPATWADVCERLGRTSHALMQWRSIATVRSVGVSEGRWPRRRAWRWARTTTSPTPATSSTAERGPCLREQPPDPR
jgi:hypothetical protein